MQTASTQINREDYSTVTISYHFEYIKTQTNICNIYNKQEAASKHSHFV